MDFSSADIIGHGNQIKVSSDKIHANVEKDYFLNIDPTSKHLRSLSIHFGFRLR